MEVRFMLRKMGLLILVGLLAAAAPVRVDDAYNIKLKKSGKGEVSHHKKNSTEIANFKVENGDGKVVNEKKEKKIVIEEYKETLVEKEKGKRATKIRREYSKATTKTGDKETTLPYDGKTLLIEKKGDKYHFTIEDGAELTGKDAADLDRSFNKESKDNEEDLEKAFLPKKAVKVNETWKVDTDELIKALDKDTKSPFPVDKSKASGTGKLLRAYKKDGRQFGVFDIQIDMPLKGEFPLGKDQGAPVQEGSKMTMRFKGDACIDGSSSDSEGEMSMDIDLVATFKGPDGKDFKMTLQAKSKGKETEAEAAKK
jgi:hypothetical protein